MGYTNSHHFWFELKKFIDDLFVTIHMLQSFDIIQELYVIVHMLQSFDIVELFVIVHIPSTKVQHWHCRWLSYMN
jgi:hypothetical protein